MRKTGLIYLPLFFLLMTGCMRYDGYDNFKYKAGEKAIANYLNVTYRVENKDKVSTLYFENYCDYSVSRSRFSSEITVIWCCCNFESKHNSYVSMRFYPHKIKGWEVINIYTAPGICK